MVYENKGGLVCGAGFPHLSGGSNFLPFFHAGRIMMADRLVDRSLQLLIFMRLRLEMKEGYHLRYQQTHSIPNPI